jgi:hypothetical protein
MTEFLEVKIVEFSDEHKKELSNLVVKSLKLHSLMKIVLMVYIEDMINSIDDPDCFYTREHDGVIMFVCLMEKARDFQDELISRNLLHWEDVEEALEGVRNKSL